MRAKATLLRSTDCRTPVQNPHVNMTDALAEAVGVRIPGGGDIRNVSTAIQADRGETLSAFAMPTSL
jgi:hypothetical protein